MKMLALSLLLCAVMVLTRAQETQENAVADANTDAEMTDLVKRTSTCPSGWKTFGDRCFCFVSHEMTWARAEKNCQTMGGNLASVHNASQYDRIQRIILKASNGFPLTWVGGTDAQETGLWLWTDGSSFNYKHCGSFNGWFWRQHCLQMNYGTHKCWIDAKCSNSLPSVCAKKCKNGAGNKGQLLELLT